MRQFLQLVTFALFCIFLSSCTSGDSTVLIKTNKGDITVLLFDETPRHKENFLKLAKENYYAGTLFHRVIPEFMIQGGDPESIGAAPGTMLGGGGPSYLIDHEIGQPHLRGALAAARTNNPQKASSGSQFYIAHGRPVTEAELNKQEAATGVRYPSEVRAAYLENGGVPFLDQGYTVFGQVIEGLDVIDKIAATKTATGDRPVEDVWMKISLIH